MKEKIIDFLLEIADPSIVLRVKREILKNISNEEENELLNKIIPQKNVQTILQSQKPDGWFGNHFHGQSVKFGAGMYDNMEVGLRYLAEKGFPPENEIVKKAVNSFLLKSRSDYAVYRFNNPKPPATDYSYTAFGLYFIICSLIVRAGHEFSFPENENIDINHDVDFSFKTFANVINYESPDDAIETHRRKANFKQGVLWPCMYDLKVLAHSKGWRSEINVSLLADTVSHLLSFPQTGVDVYTYINGQFYAPCWAFIYNSIFNGTVRDFDTLELFARCGIVKQAAALKMKYDELLSLVDENLYLNIAVDKRKDFKWGPYYGFAIEENWKNEVKIQCDLLFRILMIMHYTGD